MKPNICRCCGEPIAGWQDFSPRNPNICAACAKLLDEIDSQESWRGQVNPGLPDVQLEEELPDGSLPEQPSPSPQLGPVDPETGQGKRPRGPRA